MCNFKTILLAGAAATLLATPAAAADNGYFTLGTGASYSKGDYGEASDTKVLAVPVSLTYRKGGLKVRVSVPWVTISGPGSLIQTPEGRDAGGGLGGGTGGDNSGSGSSGSGSGDSGSNSGSGSSGSGSSGSGSSGSGSSGSGSSGSGSSGSGSSGSGSGGSGSGSSTGGGDVVVDDGAVPSPTGNGRRSGIGDVTVSAVYSFDLGGDFYFEPGLKFKLPTASRSKRIGTGKLDVTVSADLVKDIGDASVYLHGRRKFAGQPTGSDIRSTWGAGTGVSYRIQNGLAVGADYDWQQSSVAGRGSSSELTGWTYFRVAKGVGMTVSATKGLNRNSADFAVATALAFRL